MEAAAELVVDAETRFVELWLAKPRDGEKIMDAEEDMEAAKEAFAEALESFRGAMVKAALGMQAVIRAGGWRPTGLVNRLNQLLHLQWIEEANDEMGSFEELSFMTLVKPFSFASSFARSYKAVATSHGSGARGQ